MDVEAVAAAVPAADMAAVDTAPGDRVVVGAVVARSAFVMPCVPIRLLPAAAPALCRGQPVEAGRFDGAQRPEAEVAAPVPI